MADRRGAVAAKAAQQEGVITCAQCRRLGCSTDWVADQVRTGRWQRLHRGVLVTYSGPVTWRSRAWAALLRAGPGAALGHRSAALLHGLIDRPPSVIEVTVPHRRRVEPSAGMAVRRRVHLAVVRRGGLPVVSRGDAVLDLLEIATSDDDAVGVLCSTLRAGGTPGEVIDALDRRPSAKRRRIVRELLAIVSSGIESPLELRYQRDVERAHGLPCAALQRRTVVGGVWVRADRVYDGLGVRVELDGELAHPGGRTDADVWRDNAVVVACAEITLRYRWRHVRLTPCRTAAQVVDALRSRGWRGTPRRCSPGCPVR